MSAFHTGDLPFSGSTHSNGPQISEIQRQSNPPIEAIDESNIIPGKVHIDPSKVTNLNGSSQNYQDTTPKERTGILSAKTTNSNRNAHLFNLTENAPNNGIFSEVSFFLLIFTP